MTFHARGLSPEQVAQAVRDATGGGIHVSIDGSTRLAAASIRTSTTTSLPLVARGKLNPARLVTRQIALGDVTDTLQRMTRYETVGFEAIARFA